MLTLSVGLYYGQLVIQIWYIVFKLAVFLWMIALMKNHSKQEYDE